ncbi:MAG: PadR family transcriptional regulator [Methanothrix sp.]|nr:MAG: PadR family transcriptional regulator [Methanothrix sp.]
MKGVQVTKQNSDRPAQKEGPVADTNQYISRIIKNNLDVVVLATLAKKPVCGYDLIKDIFSKYNVCLSQGTVYPLLYVLREKGVLQVEFAKSDMRTKVYYITTDGEEFVREELNEFVTAVEVVMSLIEGGSDV